MDRNRVDSSWGGAATVWAHSRNPDGQRHALVDHLRSVARIASEYASKFEAGDAAYWAGLWHDCGKFHPEFQRYLAECEAHPGLRRHGPDHKGAGAVLAAKECQPLAFLIAGHHGGLPGMADLKGRLREWGGEGRIREAIELARAAVPELTPGRPIVLPRLGTGGRGRGERERNAELFLRMVFSAVVDADFLDTEGHFSQGVGLVREAVPSLAELWPWLEASQAQLSGKGRDRLSQIRHEVYQACLRAAEAQPGLFRLTVPTGGGKTRSSLAFAMRHALRHGLDRVIVALPYTSITEQTAREYRDIFGSEHAVLEHHSGVWVSD